ncbi:MAG: hypothetical protein WDM87_17405 [Terracidiphilus sp.]
MRRVWRQTATARHLLDADQWFERAQEDAASQTFFLAGEIHAVIAAIDEVDVRVTRRPEEGEIARRWARDASARRDRGVVLCGPR